MRLTALLDPAISSQMNRISTITGSVKSRGSRMKEIAWPAGRLAAVVLEPRRDGQPAEDHRDHGLADELGPAAQAEAALPVDLDVVVEEADDAEPDEQEEQQQGRGARGVAGDQGGEEVGEHRGQHDHQAAHGRRAALGVVRGRSVVADQLAVAAVGEDRDRVAGADQGEQQRQATGEQDRSHAGASSPGRSSDPPPARSCSATRSRRPDRDALTSTTSGPRTFSRTQATASSTVATWRVDVAVACASSSRPRGCPRRPRRRPRPRRCPGHGPGRRSRGARRRRCRPARASRPARRRSAAVRPSGPASPGRSASSRGWRCRRR